MTKTIYTDHKDFISNKYSQWYYSIISNAQCQDRTKGLGKYFENHHILPQSIFPEFAKEKWNKVLLTAKEHFICHHLLIKCTSNNSFHKMIKAFDLLSKTSSNNITSIVYEKLKVQYSISMSGSNNPMFGKTSYNKGISISKSAKESLLKGAKQWRDSGGMTDEYKDKISKSLKGRKKPEGFGQHLSQAISGESHHSFKGYFHTPFGKLSAASHIKEHTNLLSDLVVKKWTSQPDKPITKNVFCQSKYLKTLSDEIIIDVTTYRDIGFWFI